MNPNYKRWQKLFLWCLGLAVGTAFCMKWMEADLLQNGEKFTIVGLEICYSRERIMAIFSGLDPGVKNILRYHLYFDFAYMAGVFPGIAALLMMARERSVGKISRKILFALAALQTLAWACDIFENLQLLSWIKDPVIGNEFGIFHVVVWTKFVISILGILMALAFVFRRRKQIH
jgi:hypothetical protein